MTQESKMSDVEKLEALAKAADEAESKMNSIHSRTGNSLKYWDAAKEYDEAAESFKDFVDFEKVLALISTNRTLQSELAAARAGNDAVWNAGRDAAANWHDKEVAEINKQFERGLANSDGEIQMVMERIFHKRVANEIRALTRPTGKAEPSP
jgi:hypothetical protein